MIRVIVISPREVGSTRGRAQEVPEEIAYLQALEIDVDAVATALEHDLREKVQSVDVRRAEEVEPRREERGRRPRGIHVRVGRVRLPRLVGVVAYREAGVAIDLEREVRQRGERTEGLTGEKGAARRDGRGRRRRGR